MSPYENVIVGNSFEEIVFSNRNKAYGAYVLRKKQKKFLFIAFLSSLFLLLSSVVTPLIYNHQKGNQGPLREIGPVVMKMDSDITIVPPAPPELRVDQVLNRFVPPQVVDTVNDNELQLLAFDDIVAISEPQAPPTTIEVIQDTDPVIPIEEKPFITVEVSAKFNGGDLVEFNKWVAQNIKYPQLAYENGISGRVTVQFVVNAQGKVENATVLRGVDPSLDQEAIRVIQSSPKWSPPLQSGRAVKQLFSLPVVFKLQQ